jgi:hypothetical protein
LRRGLRCAEAAPSRLIKQSGVEYLKEQMSNMIPFCEERAA